MPNRSLLWLDLAVKAALVGLLVFALARPDLPQFAGKAVTGRAIGYPVAALLVPAVWFLTVFGAAPRTRTPWTSSWCCRS